MDTPCPGQVLLVGDGDFSFTLSLMKISGLRGSQVTTSNLESLETIQQHNLASDCMKTLKDMGVCVLLETDARELHTHAVINKETYHRVIFNFPLADRHNIKKNRALLADFFSSCSQILSDEGQVMVTLCKGQGGTPADQPMRSWHDSWQVQAMASSAGFILTNVQPFEASRYPDYHSVGFRFQDKSFNTDGALTHIFEKADVVSEKQTVRARGSVEHKGDHYSCSEYVAEKLKRNLLQETNNPVSLLRERLEVILTSNLETKVLSDELFYSILKSHRSYVKLSSNCFADENTHIEGFVDTADNDCDGEMDTGEDRGDALESMKEMKNKANLSMKTVKPGLFVHGVDKGQKEHSETTSAGKTDKMCEKSCAGELLLSRIIPEDSESVYVLIRGSGRSSCMTEGNDGENEDDMQPSGRLDSDLHNEQEACYGGTETLSQEVIMKETDADQQGYDCADRVFHCRTSLLENLLELYPYIYENLGGVKSSSLGNSESLLRSGPPSCDKVKKDMSSDVTSGDSAMGHIESSSSDSSGNPAVIADKENHCVIVSGQCFFPGPILPDSLPVRHELMVVHVLENDMCNSHAHCNAHPYANPADDSYTQNSSDTFPKQCYISVSNTILSCLQNSDLFSSVSLSTHEVPVTQEIIRVDGFDKVCNVKVIQMESASHDEDLPEQGVEIQGSSVTAGFMLTAIKDSHHLCMCVLELDTITCKLCGIKDPRLLWSSSEKFISQFKPSSFPKPFSQFSLYPMKFAHDLSFWEKDSESDFDVNEMYDIIRCVTGDTVVNVTLVDLYTDPNTGRLSRCYRLYFLAHDQALPYLVSWKLQSLIRMEIAQKLGVMLR